MNNLTKVSIILPTHNGEKYIKRAINSVLSQSFLEWEFIIIDDGSIDSTKNIIKEYSDKDKRIIYLQQDNSGPSVARRYGISVSKGEYLAFLDDDDEWIDKDKLKKQIEFLDNNKDYILVGSGAVLCKETGEELFKCFLPIEDKKIRNKFLFKNCFMQSSVVIKKESYFVSGGYSNIKHLYAEDYDLWLRIGYLGKMYNFPNFFIKYTVREKSISSLNKIQILRNNIKIIYKNRKRYPYFILAVFFGYIKILYYKILNFLPSCIKNNLFKFYKEF